MLILLRSALKKADQETIPNLQYRGAHGVVQSYAIRTGYWCAHTRARIMISVCVHRCTLRAYCASKKMHIREKHRGAMCVKKKGERGEGPPSSPWYFILARWIREWDRIGLSDTNSWNGIEGSTILILMRNFDKCTVTRVENYRGRQIPFHRG